MDCSNSRRSSLPGYLGGGPEDDYDRTLVLYTYLELLYGQVNELYRQVLEIHAASMKLPKPPHTSRNPTTTNTTTTTTNSRPANNNSGQTEDPTTENARAQGPVVDMSITRMLQGEYRDIQVRLTSLLLQVTVALNEKHISSEDYEYLYTEQEKLNNVMADIEQRLTATEVLYERSEGISDGLYQSLFGEFAMQPSEQPVPNPYNPKYAGINEMIRRMMQKQSPR